MFAGCHLSAGFFRHTILWGLFCLAGLTACADEARMELNFNSGWRFTKSDPANAASPAFNDRDWSTISVPHTFNDTDTFNNFALPGLRGEQNQWSGRTW